MPPSHIDQNQTPSADKFNNDRSPLRDPHLGPMEQMWIALAVIIPSVFVIILCVTTACIYRYRKKRAQRNAINPTMTSIDQHNAAVATIFHNSRQGPIIMEELPPSYEFIIAAKKDLQYNTTSTNTSEQLQPSSIKNEVRVTVPSTSNTDTVDSSK